MVAKGDSSTHDAALCGNELPKAESTFAGKKAESSEDALRIAGSGSRPTAQSHPDLKSITSTTIHSITTSETSPAFLRSGTTDTINDCEKITGSLMAPRSADVSGAESIGRLSSSLREAPEHGRGTASRAPPPTSPSAEVTPSVEPSTMRTCAPIDAGAPRNRFFYTSKAGREERELEDGTRSTHPTVKPVDLMRWLVRLVTPPGGVVLDPFMGSGSTGVACVHERFRFIGIEREVEYVAIARARLDAATRQGVLDL
jgi:hypothetical protein